MREQNALNRFEINHMGRPLVLMLCLMWQMVAGAATPLSNPCLEGDVYRISVPRDYDHPENGSLTYAFQFKPGADSNAPFVVNIPGGPGDHSIGKPVQGKIVPSRYAILLTDPRGTGCNTIPTSEIPDRGTQLFSSKNVARDILEAIKYVRQQFHVNEFVIRGISYGTQVATILASLAEKEGVSPKSVYLTGVYGRAVTYGAELLRNVEKQWLKVKRTLPEEVVEAIAEGETPLGISPVAWAAFLDKTLMKGTQPGVGNVLAHDLRLLFGRPVSEKEELEKSALLKMLRGGSRPKNGHSPDSSPARQPTSTDWFNKAIGCQEQNDVDHQMAFRRGHFTLAQRQSGQCDGLHFRDKFDSFDWPIAAPIYYFVGGADPHTWVDRAAYHYHGQKTATKYFILLPEGGHGTEPILLSDCFDEVWTEIAQAADPAKALKACSWFHQSHATPILASSHPILARSKLAHRITHLVNRHVDPKGAPGSAIGIAVGVFTDREMHRLGFGATQKNTPFPPDERTLFQIGSVTKVFTSLLLAEQVARGNVPLETPAQRFFPKGHRAPTFHGRPMTLLDLATHYSGLPPMPDNLTSPPPNRVKGYSSPKLFEFLSRYKLKHAPGTEYLYSNLGMGLLGVLLERMTGESFEALVHHGITSPLGMRDTRVILGEAQRERLAQGYENGEAVPPAEFGTGMQSAGALFSTVEDLLRFLKAATGDGPLSHAFSLVEKPRRPEGQGKEIGLGLNVKKTGKVFVWDKPGSTPGGFHAYLTFSRHPRQAVVILGNSGKTRLAKIGNDILDVLETK